MRQAVLDWEFLDTSLAKCRPADEPPSADSNESYASTFATVVLDTLELQCRQHFDLAAVQTVHELVNQIKDIQKLIDLAGEANKIHARVIEGSSSVSAVSSSTYNSASLGSSTHGSSTHGSMHGSAHGSYSSTMSQTQYAEFSAIRTLIQKKSGDAKSAMDQMVETIAGYFAKVCGEVKPVMDVYEIIHAQSPTTSTPSGFGSHTGGNGTVMASGVDLMRRFIQHVCSLLEVYYGVRHSREGLQGSTEQADFHLGYLYDEWSHVARPWEATHLPPGRLLTFQPERKKQLKTGDDSGASLINVNANVSATGTNATANANVTLYPYIEQLWEKTLANTAGATSGTSGLIVHAFFHRCASQLIGRLENELTTADLYSFTDEKAARVSIVCLYYSVSVNIILTTLLIMYYCGYFRIEQCLGWLSHPGTFCFIRSKPPLTHCVQK